MAGLVVSLGLAFFAIGPFAAIGIWYQSEPVIAAGFAAAALCALGLALDAMRRPTIVGRVVSHPLVLVPLGIAGWSLAMAPLVAVPLGSMLGSPQLGEGIVSHLALAILAAAALLARHTRRGRLLVGGAALALATAAAALTLSGAHRWMPYFFPDFLAFYGFFAWAVAIAWLPSRRVWGHARIAVTVATLALVFASGNRAAVGSLVAGAVAFLIWHGLARRVAPAALRRAGTGLAVALPLAATAAIAWLHHSGLAAVFGDSAAGTLGSRARMLDVVAEAVAAHPALLATGDGWGRFTELLLAHLPLADVTLHSLSPAPGATFWDALNRADFHSHNALAESLVGGGLPALLLTLALPALLPLMAPRRLLAPAVALAVMLGLTQAFWFQMPVTQPYMMVAFAGLCPRPRRPRAVRPWPRALAGGLALAAMLLLAASATVLVIAMAARHAAEANLAASPPAPAARCAPILDDFGRGEDHFVWLYRQQANRLMEDVRADRTPAPAVVERMQRYLCRAEQRAGRGAGRQIRVIDAIIRGDMVFVVGEKAPALATADAAGWSRALDRVLTVAPKRTDLFAAWFFWQLGRGGEAEILSRTRQLLAQRPDDPVALWFSGLALLKDPARSAEGMARLGRALDNGVERIFPIDSKTVAAVRRRR